MGLFKARAENEVEAVREHATPLGERGRMRDGTFNRLAQDLFLALLYKFVTVYKSLKLLYPGGVNSLRKWCAEQDVEWCTE